MFRKSRKDLIINRSLVSPDKPVVNFNAFAESKVSSKSMVSEQNQNIVNDYLESSSVHGIKYFGKISVRVSNLGRFIWMCTMIAGVVCSSLMVYKFWNRYRQNQTYTYAKSFHEPLTSIPFPSVTICPFRPNTAKKREFIVNNLVVPDNMTIEDVHFIIAHMHELAIPDVVEQERFSHYKEQLEKILSTNDLELPQLLRDSVSCGDMLKACKFNGLKVKCRTSFRVSHSSEGICCAFNFILEEHMLGHTDVKPIYPLSYGEISGLKVVIEKEILVGQDSDPLNRIYRSSAGTLVTVHHHSAYSGDIFSSRILQSNDELQIEVIPTVQVRPIGFSHTTPEGDTVPFCIPDSKTAIKYFPIYRYSNCFTSCKITRMISSCDCVPFNYYPVTWNSSIKSCTLSDYSCLKQNAHRFRIVQDIRRKNFTCICRQPCTNIWYDARITQTYINQSAVRVSPSYGAVTDGDAVLRVFMQSQFVTVFETIPATTEISLLASLGGIFALFLGCSFLSAAEIIYFGILFYRNITFSCSERARNKTPRRKHNFYAGTKIFH